MTLTDDILINNGFSISKPLDEKLNEKYKEIFGEDYHELEMFYQAKASSVNDHTYKFDFKYGLSNSHLGNWTLHIDNAFFESVGSIDLGTVEQFNALMQIIECDFRLKTN